MSVTGKITKQGAIYTGFIASLGFDEEITLRENPRHKANAKAPKFEVFGKSPRGREINCGAAWLKTSEEKKTDYLSLTLSIQGQKVNCNAVQIKKSGMNNLTILPFSDN